MAASPVLSLTACTLRQCKDNAFWPQSYIQTRMHHHNISGCLLCVRQLRGGQSQDEVSYLQYFNRTYTWRSILCVYRRKICTVRYQPATLSVMMILWSLQGVCQDHQASLHSAVQPLHPERGCAKGHSQHQQRGGGASTWARHHRWCPLQAEQADGCLTACTEAAVIHPQSINACHVVPKHHCTLLRYRLVSTMNVPCFWRNAVLSPLCGMKLKQKTH